MAEGELELISLTLAMGFVSQASLSLNCGPLQGRSSSVPSH